MSLKKVITKVIGGGSGSDAIEGILPSQQFHRVLNRERALSDRHGLKFCLVVFQGSNGHGKEELASIAGLLGKRLRATDIAGWIDPDHVGAILPHTPLPGASRVAEKICELASSNGAKPQFEVIPYPSDQSGHEGGTLGDKKPAADKTTFSQAAPEPRAEQSADVPVAASTTVDKILAPAFPLWKRVLDIFLASTALIVLSPLMLAVAAFIKIVSPGPELFRQERVGFLREHFQCLKFRTMHVNADTQAHNTHFSSLMQTDTPMKKLDMQKDPRVIPFGRLLRASGIDELPQLVNILRGEMSFIGPRPCIQYEFDNYKLWQKRRCDARPGLTGMWQVSGKSRTTFNQMMRLDISYSRDESFWKDIKIIFRTFPAVFREIGDTFGLLKR